MNRDKPFTDAIMFLLPPKDREEASKLRDEVESWLGATVVDVSEREVAMAAVLCWCIREIMWLRGNT